MDPGIIHKVFSTVKWKGMGNAQAVAVISYFKTYCSCQPCLKSLSKEQWTNIWWARPGKKSVWHPMKPPLRRWQLNDSTSGRDRDRSVCSVQHRTEMKLLALNEVTWTLGHLSMATPRFSAEKWSLPESFSAAKLFLLPNPAHLKISWGKKLHSNYP